MILFQQKVYIYILLLIFPLYIYANNIQIFFLAGTLLGLSDIHKKAIMLRVM